MNDVHESASPDDAPTNASGSPAPGGPADRPWRWTAPALVAMLSLGGIATWQTARMADRELRSQLLTHAHIAEQMLEPRLLTGLSGTPADTERADYQRLKGQLTRLRGANPTCRFTYLLGRRPDGTVFFFADSEPENSKDYSPPGQVYDEVTAECAGVFANGRPTTEGPARDRWGTWVSALVPLKVPGAEEPVAVLGMDVDSRHWGRTIAARCVAPAALTAILILLLVVFLQIHNRTTLENRRLAAAAAAMRERREELRAILDTVQTGVFILDADSRTIVDANPAALRLIGAPREAVIGRTCHRYVCPAEQGKCPVMDLGQTVDCSERILLTSDGRRIPILKTVGPLHINGRRHLVESFVDISGLRQKEAERQAIQSRYKTLFDSSSDAVMTLDANGFLDCNKATLTMFGLETADAFAALHPAQLSPPTQPSGVDSRTLANQRIEEALTMGSCQFEWVHRRRTGEDFPAEVWLTAFSMGGRRILQATVRDITARKREEEERRRMQAQLHEAQKTVMIGTLARGVAHEVNNPLNGIMNYAQLLRDELETGSTLAAYADEIIAESRRVATMTHSLLRFSQHGATQEPAPATPTDLTSSLLPPAARAAEARNIAFTADIPADLPSVMCRRGQITQLIMALISNALESFGDERTGLTDTTAGAAGTIRLTARRVESEGRAWLRLTVEDDGPGIPSSIRDRVFDPFFTTKDRTQHSGLGLWISRSVASDHEGKLTLESSPGSGTRVELTLPAAPSGQTVEDPEASKIEEGAHVA